MDSSGEYWRCQISDDGIGIPKKYLSRVFERFYRVDPSRSSNSGGTGIGLAIVKHMIQLMGGNVYIESEEGVGTSVIVLFLKNKS
jgi:signal transduction histidine kinase